MSEAQSPTSNHEEKAISQKRHSPMHAMLTELTLLSKATINASITDVEHISPDDIIATVVNNQCKYQTQVSQTFLTVKTSY